MPRRLWTVMGVAVGLVLVTMGAAAVFMGADDGNLREPTNSAEGNETSVVQIRLHPQVTEKELDRFLEEVRAYDLVKQARVVESSKPGLGAVVHVWAHDFEAAERVGEAFVDRAGVASVGWAVCDPVQVPSNAAQYPDALERYRQAGCPGDPAIVVEAGELRDGRPWEIIAYTHPEEGLCVGHRSIPDVQVQCGLDDQLTPQSWTAAFADLGRAEGPLAYGPVTDNVALVEVEADDEVASARPVSVGDSWVAGTALPEGVTTIVIVWLDEDGTELARSEAELSESPALDPHGRQPLSLR